MAQSESADGRLLAIDHPEGGGIFLRADFSDLVPTPRKVRFLRGFNGDPVRSGHNAWAPGGIAKAYDREAPGGVSSAWYAIPIFWEDGAYVDGPSSAGTALVAPAVDATKDFWLKSISTPLQLRLRSLGHNLQQSKKGRDFGQEIPGDRYLSGGWDIPTADPVTYRFVTETLAEFQLLDELTDSGPFLMQQYDEYGNPDAYFKLDRQSWEYHVSPTDPRRAVTLVLNPCHKPPTESYPMYISGHSWDDVKVAWTSWNALMIDVATWDDLMITAPPLPGGITPESGGSGDEGGP